MFSLRCFVRRSRNTTRPSVPCCVCVSRPPPSPHAVSPTSKISSLATPRATVARAPLCRSKFESLHILIRTGLHTHITQVVTDYALTDQDSLHRVSDWTSNKPTAFCPPGTQTEIGWTRRLASAVQCCGYRAVLTADSDVWQWALSQDALGKRGGLVAAGLQRGAAAQQLFGRQRRQRLLQNRECCQMIPKSFWIPPKIGTYRFWRKKTPKAYEKILFMKWRYNFKRFEQYLPLLQDLHTLLLQYHIFYELNLNIFECLCEIEILELNQLRSHSVLIMHACAWHACSASVLCFRTLDAEFIRVGYYYTFHAFPEANL